MAQWGTLKGSLEKSVVKLAQKVQQIYKNKCAQQNANCNTKSYDECRGIDARECIQYPQREGCPWSGTSVSKSGGIRFPQTVDITSLKNTEKLFICKSYEADEVMKQIKIKFNTKINRVYFGTYFGYFRAYPATQRDQTVNNVTCLTSFDPRTRPWFIAAATGIKNVVIVINNSMAERNLAQSKRMVKAIIDTLGTDDFVSIVTYPVATSLLGPGINIQQVKKINKSSLKTSIDSLTVNAGLNNYESAFNKVKEMLTEQKNKSICLPPNNIVFFLTDTAPNDGTTVVSDLISNINLWNNDKSYSMKLFSYGVGPNVDKTFLKDLSCNFNGQFFSLADTTTSSDMISFLPRLYAYQSSISAPTQPLWSDPFTDASTGDRIVGVSMPVYYEQNNYRQVLGAANIAVKISTLTGQYGFNSEQQIIDEVVRYRCVNNVLTQNDYESLRKDKCLNSSNTLPQTCAFIVTSDIVGQPPLKGAKQRYECCSFTTGGFVGLILGLFFGILIIVAAILGYRYYKKRRDLLNDRNVGPTSEAPPLSGLSFHPLSATSPPKIKSAPPVRQSGDTKIERVTQQVSSIDCSKST